MILTTSIEVSHEDKPSDSVVVAEYKKNGVLIRHKCHNENHLVRDCKANTVKDKAYYLIMVQEEEEKEKEKAFVAHV